MLERLGFYQAFHNVILFSWLKDKPNTRYNTKSNNTDNKTVEPATTTVAAPAKNTTDEQPAIVATSKYHIIVASSPTEANANLAIKELTSKAKIDYVKVESNGRFRISAGNYNTQEEAQASLSTIQATFPDAWIFKHQ